MSRLPPLAIGLLLAACNAGEGGSNPFATGGATEAGATGSSSSSGSSGSTTSGAEDTTGAPGDPAYPSPDPVAPDGTCPTATFGPITFEGSAWVCIPECDADSTCPQPETGTAEAACATNPQSSATPCSSDADCTIANEACGNAGGGERACLLPPSHCILRCDDTMTCPDGMLCTSASVCAYPG